MISYKFSIPSPAGVAQTQRLKQAQTQVQLPRHMLDLLQRSGADVAQHSQRRLLDHLVGTYQLLQNWGMEQHVCTAGLFHSIYGTNIYTHQSIAFSDRAQVQAAIGMQAEHLSWLFCSIDRPQAFFSALEHGVLRNRIDGTDIACQRQVLRELLDIECANQIEQGGRIAFLQRIFSQADKQQGIISPQVHIAVKQYLLR
jgi:hypothetical protein